MFWKSIKLSTLNKHVFYRAGCRLANSTRSCSTAVALWLWPLTYLVIELRQLDLHLLPLEHVVLGLLTDGRDQVELPRHRVRLLKTHTHTHTHTNTHTHRRPITTHIVTMVRVKPEALCYMSYPSLLTHCPPVLSNVQSIKAHKPKQVQFRIDTGSLWSTPSV